jgi:predicted Fe-Mo cluster-binding NifX family protein
MDYSDIKKTIKLIEYEEDCRRARQEFREYGVRFYDAHGHGFIRDGVKHYS